jgi:hypothetical protein
MVIRDRRSKMVNKRFLMSRTTVNHFALHSSGSRGMINSTLKSTCNASVVDRPYPPEDPV